MRVKAAMGVQGSRILRTQRAETVSIHLWPHSVAYGALGLLLIHNAAPSPGPLVTRQLMG